jgi:hypothetical protein
MHNVPCISSKGVLVVSMALLLILPLMVAHKGRAAEDKVMTALYEAAKKEGGLTIYSPAELVLRGVEKELPKTFAGLEVRSATVEPTELATKLITEKRSGGVRADLNMGSLRDVVDLLDRGIISAQDYASMGIPQELVLFDSKLVGIWNVAFAHYDPSTDHGPVLGLPSGQVAWAAEHTPARAAGAGWHGAVRYLQLVWHDPGPGPGGSAVHVSAHERRYAWHGPGAGRGQSGGRWWLAPHPDARHDTGVMPDHAECLAADRHYYPGVV